MQETMLIGRSFSITVEHPSMTATLNGIMVEGSDKHRFARRYATLYSRFDFIIQTVILRNFTPYRFKILSNFSGSSKRSVITAPIVFHLYSVCHLFEHFCDIISMYRFDRISFRSFGYEYIWNNRFQISPCRSGYSESLFQIYIFDTCQYLCGGNSRTTDRSPFSSTIRYQMNLVVERGILVPFCFQ